METDAGDQRVGVGSILAVAFAGLALVVAGFALSGGQAKNLDGQARLAESFEVRGLPLDLPVALALEFPGGEQIVQLGDAAGLELEAELRAGQEKSSGSKGKGGRGSWGKKPEPDPIWKTLGPGDAVSPFEVTFIWYPEKGAEGALSKLFGSSSFGDIGSLGKDGGEVLIEGGRLPWGEFEVPFRRYRTFERIDDQPVFRDLLRANLSRDREACVVFLRWRHGEEGTQDSLREVLDVIRPL